MHFYNYLLSFFLVFFSTNALAERTLPDNNLGYPVFIKLQNSTGSGFYLNTDHYRYLVTAKHVLFNQAQNLVSEQAELTSFSGQPDDDIPNRFILNLKDLSISGFILKHPTQDIVLIRLGTIIKDKELIRINHFDSVNPVLRSKYGTIGASLEGLKKLENVLVSNDVYLFGYPTSLGLADHPQLDRERPLLRKGIVAGINPSIRSIVLDCASYPGNSGGPILEVESDSFGNRHFRIIGIMREFVPLVDTWVTRFGSTNSTIMNSGYSIATPIDFIWDLLASEEKEILASPQVTKIDTKK